MTKQSEGEFVTTETTLDLDYVRRVGEEVRSRLFPRPNRFGQQPVPLPTLLRYRPEDGIDAPVLFVGARFVQVVEMEPPDVRPSLVYVAWGDRMGTVDVAFGKDPRTPKICETPDEQEALAALLGAVAGVL